MIWQRASMPIRIWLPLCWIASQMEPGPFVIWMGDSREYLDVWSGWERKKKKKIPQKGSISIGVAKKTAWVWHAISSSRATLEGELTWLLMEGPVWRQTVEIPVLCTLVCLKQLIVCQPVYFVQPWQELCSSNYGKASECTRGMTQASNDVNWLWSMN